MMSQRLEAAVKKVSTLNDGYVFHPVVIRLAIDVELKRVEILNRGPLPDYVTSNVKQHRVCQVVDCNRGTHAHSLCHAHYKRYLRGTFSGEQLNEVKKPRRGGKKFSEIARRAMVKSAVINVMGGKCMLCYGSFPPAVFDFHHVFDKKYEINQLIPSANSEALTQELSKCVLLCANCHRLEHLWLRENTSTSRA